MNDKMDKEISELLFYMGATKACFDLKEIVIKKELRNETNRRINCEMANQKKTSKEIFSWFVPLTFVDNQICTLL